MRFLHKNDITKGNLIKVQNEFGRIPTNINIPSTGFPRNIFSTNPQVGTYLIAYRFIAPRLANSNNV